MMTDWLTLVVAMFPFGTGIWLLVKRNGGPVLTMSNPIRIKINTGIMLVVIGLAVAFYPAINVGLDRILPQPHTLVQPSILTQPTVFKENINEIEENDFPSQANAIQFGQTMHGSLGVNDTDIYALMVERGDQIAVELLTDSPHPLITAEIQTKGKKVKILKADDRYVTQAVEDSEYLFVISSWRPWVDYRLHIAAGE